ncbi:MAG: TerB family tellurite resistance protein [Hyphomicrobiaceae bacterium]
MFTTIDKFLGELFDNKPAQLTDEAEERVACAALLVHCANADGIRSDEEDNRLKAILTDHFKLSSSEIGQIITAAEAQERDAVDLHRFTRILHQRLDRDGRQRMVKWLWEIAQADGTIDRDERNTVALAAQLLDVEVRDSVALRQAAERQSDTDDT